ncbi:T9SS type A sorting domain-containing protein [Flavobacterium sp. U410]
MTEDCSNFCSNAAINGISTLCTSSIYSVTNEATSCTWSITEGNSIVTYIINGNEITLTKVNGQSGYVTLNATYSNTKCGSATISKRIWVGTPKITNNTLNGHTTTSPMTIESYYVNSPGQGIVDYQWTIEVVNLSSDCTCTINSDGLIICPSGTSLARFYESGTTTYTTTSPMATVDFRTCKGQYLIKLVARNSCGSTLVTSSYITIKSAQDCDTSLKAFPNPVTDNELTVVMRPAPGDPCGDDVITLKVNNEEKEPIKIYDFYGNIVYSGTIERGENKISDLNLKSGNYILNVFAKTGEVIREVIIVK